MVIVIYWNGNLYIKSMVMRIEDDLDGEVYDFDIKQPKVASTWVIYKVGMNLYVIARESFTVRANKLLSG